MSRSYISSPLVACITIVSQFLLIKSRCNGLDWIQVTLGRGPSPECVRLRVL